MKIDLLIEKFYTGINWNAFLYIAYKIFFVALSFMLYNSLPTHIFSLWATTNSIIFLSLLWIDGGFRKSIPRFCPAFAYNNRAHHLFIRSLIIIKVVILSLFTPIVCIVIVPRWIIGYHLIPSFSWYISLLFLVEGTVGIFRLIYHAHFWQKQFNTTQLYLIFIEAIGSFIYLYSCSESPEKTVCQLFFNKIVTGIVLIIIASMMLKRLYADKTYQQSKPINLPRLIKDFVIHSLMMWGSNTIKSLSERNFLLLYFSHTLGPATANLFKVIHDGALSFHRIAIKSIGTADTSLLSHIQTHYTRNTKKNLNTAFFILVKKVATISIPLMSINAAWSFNTQGTNKETIILFSIIALGYLIEVALSPFERILEVKQHYGLLWISYTPYIIGMFIIFILGWEQSNSLIILIGTIHCIRLMGSVLTMFFACKQYALSLPTKFVIQLISISLALVVFFTFCVRRLNFF